MSSLRSTELPVAWMTAVKCRRSASSGTPPSPMCTSPRNSTSVVANGCCSTRMTDFIFTWSGATP
jgi:hypothetical protein